MNGIFGFSRRRFNWRHAFFSLHGRLSRRSFWLAALIAAALSPLVYFSLVALLRASGNEDYNEVIAVATFIEFVVMLYPRLAIEIKRLHDFDWSGWWAVPMNLLQPFAVLVYSVALQSVDSEGTRVGLGVSIPLALYIVLGAPRGDRRQNRFGMPT